MERLERLQHLKNIFHKTKMTSQFVLNVIVVLFAKTEICVLLLYIFRLLYILWHSHCV